MVLPIASGKAPIYRIRSFSSCMLTNLMGACNVQDREVVRTAHCYPLACDGSNRLPMKNPMDV
jgi:hypothetical protein